MEFGLSTAGYAARHYGFPPDRRHIGIPLGHRSRRRADVSRDARPDDDHFGKVNGLGGKLEKDESVVAGLRREIQEETGLELVSFVLRGTVTWTNFGPNREQWLAFIFLAIAWRGSPPPSNEEGTLRWVDRSRLLSSCDGTSPDDHLPMWAGDRHFVPLVFDDDPRQFHGTMPYDGDLPVSWDVERL